jgi:hypothetical protein
VKISATPQVKIEVTLPTLHPGQRRIVDEARRFNVLACGRRFGKTMLGIDLLIDRALDGYPVGWFSPQYPMLVDVWKEIKRLTLPLQARVSVQEHRIELITGGVIDCWSLAAVDSARGRKYARVVIDEAAMVPNLDDAWQAVIRPTLSDYQGDAYFLSTPKGLNFFHQCYSRGMDPSQGDWMAWHAKTTDNPYISPDEVETARQELPEQVFQQEYLAEFLQNEGAVFRGIDECLTNDPTTPEQHAGHETVAGVDWGQQNDFTAISVICRTCRREVALDRFNRIEWAFQRARLTEIIREWKVTAVIAESNSIGQPNLEALILEGLPVRGFETTSASKSPLIQSLALALERRECRWLANETARLELLAYEASVNKTTGRISYSAPSGGHDDTVMARALAWKACLEGGFGNAY